MYEVRCTGYDVRGTMYGVRCTRYDVRAELEITRGVHCE
jgi:hypothetical protein